MQVKISKTLEGIIARAAFNTTKAGIDHSLKDFLMLEMLREEGSLAYQLLSSRLKDWELYQVRLRIEREVLGAGRCAVCLPRLQSLWTPHLPASCQQNRHFLL